MYAAFLFLAEEILVEASSPSWDIKEIQRGNANALDFSNF
jgi:hypothetical protein